MRCRLKVLALALPTLFLLAPGAPGQQTAGPSGPLYELRTYTAHPGKLDALNARFRDHTVKLFEKHGIRNLGYWVPKENSENKLIYVLEHASPEARQQSFRAFGADPAWQKARQESEANG
ncbi:MAG: NIPSNAP family protein, partial [Armatimonadetes bacterium]|nr:NIPSNAP family protein [Armatimonadota bacterium]